LNAQHFLDSSSGKIHCNTVWISDTHLGSKDCQVEKLKDFLLSIECKKLYLLGDIVDLWSLSKKLWWPECHYEILKIIFTKAQQGTDVIYIPGNHDIPVRDYATTFFGPIKIQSEAIHTTAKGERFLLFHGDVLDDEIRLSPWLKWVGDIGYQWLMKLNRTVSFWRRLTKQDYWSLASHLKGRLKNAREAIDIYAKAAVREAQNRGLDGVICGHIHVPEMKEIDGIRYINDGDWVEHCSALIEDHHGELSLINWRAQKPAEPDKPALAA